MDDLGGFGVIVIDVLDIVMIMGLKDVVWDVGFWI